MTIVSAHFHATPKIVSMEKLESMDGKNLVILTLEGDGDGNFLTMFFWGDSVNALVDAFEKFKKESKK